jgi:hypothetical protein
MNIKNEQLELTIDGICDTSFSQPNHPARTGHRSKLSSWWFNRMRQLVDSARDWPAAPAPRSTFQLHLSE